MSKIIVEGPDRVGKSTLIKRLVEELGPHAVVHFGKPVHSIACDMSLEKFQRKGFENGFEVLSSEANVIYDRFHLGEAIYAKRYRGYDGDYVFDMELSHRSVLKEAHLILMCTDDFSLLEDDGESFDFSQVEEETKDFVDAFERSAFRKKLMVNISDGNGGRRTPTSIFSEVINWMTAVNNEGVDPQWGGQKFILDYVNGHFEVSEEGAAQ